MYYAWIVCCLEGSLGMREGAGRYENHFKSKKGTACVFFLHLDSPMAEPMHDGTSFRFGLIWHVRFPNAADC